MKSSYDLIDEQTASRIELARTWQRNGFYDFATSTIIQAYEAVERFQRRLDRKWRLNKDYNFRSRLFNEICLTGDFSQILRDDIEWAVVEMGDERDC